MALNLDLLELETTATAPEEGDGYLDCTSLGICCSFNRRGGLLAVGCNDGRIVIWDFLTRGVAKCFPGHSGHTICSIGWSRNGQKLITTGLDNSVAIWNILSNECLFRFRMSSPILKSQFNPRNDSLVLICPLRYPGILLELDYEKGHVKYQVLPKDQEDPDMSIISSFDQRGHHIYSGNSKGRLYIVKCPKSVGCELEIISSFKVLTGSSTPTAIKEIEFSPRNKKTFIVNAADRTIKLYDCSKALSAGINGTCGEIRKFQDLVNRTIWRRCCFSGDPKGSFVCGGASRDHILYIWDTESGSIKKILQNTRGDLLLDIRWHPFRPILVSISSGFISVWGRQQIENWSAFAPDFRELEENIEYEERESEFDLEDEDNMKPLIRDEDLEIAEIDVDGYKASTNMISSDEEDLDPNYLDFIPINVDDIQAATEAAQSSEPSPIAILNDEPVKDSNVQLIDIIIEDPPVDELHPLVGSCSSKRIRVNDRIGTSRKAPKQGRNLCN